MKKFDLYDLFISKGWFDRFVHDEASLSQRKRLLALMRSANDMLRLGLIDEETYQSISRANARKRKAIYLNAMRSKVSFSERMKVISSFRKRMEDGTTAYQLKRIMPPHA